MPGMGSVQALPSTCLQKVEEQPETADNQRNVSRMGSQPLDLSTSVYIPASLASPAGDTTAAPSESPDLLGCSLRTVWWGQDCLWVAITAVSCLS